jgi:pimeloyl-ACP methyl ester carboxylesterase
MFRSRVVLLILLVLALPASSFAQSSQPSSPAASTATATSAPSTHLADLTVKEDWTKLPVDRSTLKPTVPGVEMGKSDFPTYTREWIRLQWRPGDPIDLYLSIPHGVVNPPVVIYLYSYPSGTDRFKNDGWCRRATSQGMAAAGFAANLNGDRFQYRPMSEWFVSQLQEALGSTAHDVQLVIDYLSSRGDLSTTKVGMFGQGAGGSIAMLAAIADPRIRAVDLLNPWGDWPDWLKSSPVVPEKERYLYLKPEFLAKVSALDPINRLADLKDRTLRVQQVMDDPETPETAKEKIAAATPSGHLVQFKNTDAHKESWKANGLTGWLAQQLMPEKSQDVHPAAGPQ